MGEGRGKLEALIGDLQAKKAELEKLIQEYDLMLPHLAKARDALDEAGIKDTGPPQPAPQVAAPAPSPAPPPVAPPPGAEAAPESAPEPPPAAEPVVEAEPESAPARRSIASLVAEDESSGDEATH
jgi:hypothetical protein